MRPEILFPLFAPVKSLPGIGPKLEKLVAKVAGERLVDLLWTRPNGYLDRSYRPLVADAPDGALATLTLHVEIHRPPPTKRLPYKITCRDASSFIDLVFFRGNAEYLNRTLPAGSQRIVSGRLERYDGRPQMVHPDYILSPDEAASMPAIEPVYPLTEGLTARTMAKAVHGALAHAPVLAEWQDAAWFKMKKWLGWREALNAIHAPSDVNASDAPAALDRLAFDELLANQLALAIVRNRQRALPGRPSHGDGTKRRQIEAALPFTLTGSQRMAVGEIERDMAAPHRMLRLLQGDVGSGKTVVALLAMALAVEAGRQAALMAPTEILARQHFASIAPLAEAAGMRIVLLTGRERAGPREDILADLKSGAIDMLVGTHALFSEDVAFHDLALAVVDEQHRFGVHQRLALARKNAQPVDILVMTATPIPRTLALTAYGDMDVSKLTERPAGRKPIATRTVPLSRYDDVVAAVRRAIATGARVYWVCPLVEETENSDLAAAESRARELQAVFGNRVGLVHGRLKSAEKDAAMERFKAGDISVLVATTVIEVGVDVPEATVMVIEHAERFGLAQLHQLRGRVGRGTQASSCILLYQNDPPPGATAKARLTILRETEDGFRIAEEDLRLRGAGDLLGTRQAGLPDFHFVDLVAHGELIAAARDDAALIVARDPELATPRGAALRVLLYLFERDEAVRYLRSG